MRGQVVLIVVFLTFMSFRENVQAADMDQDQIDKKCRNKGANRLSSANSCANFIQCMYDTGKIIDCDANAPCFDETKKQCVKAADCSCRKTQNGFHQFVNSYCRVHEDSWNTKVPAEECSMFYLCMGPDNDALLIQCPNGLHYSRMEEECVTPQQAGCQTLASMCNDKLAGYRFPSINCAEYYECSSKNSKPVPITCATGKYYDISSATCIVDTDFKCLSDDSKSTTATTKAATTTTKPICTADNEGQYYPHEKCYKLYVCMNKYAMEVQCGDGNYYDSSVGTCKKDIKQICVL